MLLFPGWSRFVVVTDLKLADAANVRPPRQFGDDLALPGEGVERDAMLGRPAVFGRIAEYGARVSDVGMLERELPDAEARETFDVLPHQPLAVDVAAGHHAGSAHGQPVDRLKESSERWGGFAHQLAIVQVVEVVP